MDRKRAHGEEGKGRGGGNQTARRVRWRVVAPRDVLLPVTTVRSALAPFRILFEVL